MTEYSSYPSIQPEYKRKKPTHFILIEVEPKLFKQVELIWKETHLFGGVEI